MRSQWITVLIFATSTYGVAQIDPVRLPAPNGPHPVGTVTYQWQDSERRFAYSSFPNDLRQIVVQIWYPSVSDKNAKPAPYGRPSAEYGHIQTNSRLRVAFSDGLFDCPLVMISPGRGVERFGYTTIAEALASNGYVVASVDMPEIGHVVLSDGYIVEPNPAFRPSAELMAGPYERVDEFFEQPTEIGRLDLELAFAKIRQLGLEDPSGRFVGRLDINKTGVFGHSLGGRIAGAFAEKNPAVKAYASMEGIAPRRARLQGLAMPVAMLCSSGTLPYAKDNYQSLIDGRQQIVFMLELVKFGHNSVTDFPFIQPSRFQYDTDPRAALETTVSIVLSFFDVFLKQRTDPFSALCDDLDDVVISTYEAVDKNKERP